jgi:hypothetical protein
MALFVSGKHANDPIKQCEGMTSHTSDSHLYGKVRKSSVYPVDRLKSVPQAKRGVRCSPRTQGGTAQHHSFNCLPMPISCGQPSRNCETRLPILTRCLLPILPRSLSPALSISRALYLSRSLSPVCITRGYQRYKSVRPGCPTLCPSSSDRVPSMGRGRHSQLAPWRS